MFGFSTVQVKDRTTVLEVPEGTTVGEAAQRLGITANMPWIASMDGKLVDSGLALVEGARILVFPPIAGGSVLESES